MKICEICGKEFEPKQIRSKYCSRECHIKAYSLKSPKGEEKRCLICGRLFFAERKGIKYCGEVCRMRARDIKTRESLKRRQPALQEVFCKNCGKEFLPHHKSQIYCCEECGTEYRNNHRYVDVDEKKYPPMKCVVCGAEFNPVTSRQKYCSKDCANQAQYERKRSTPYAYKKAAEEESSKQKNERKMSPASKRFASMSLREISAECARLHMSYGQAQVMAQSGTLPEDWGL